MGAIDFSELRAATPPPAWLGYRPELLASVRGAAEILAARGAVGDGHVYVGRHLARYRADRLIRLFVQFGIRERWQVRQRTWPVEGGFQWAVEFVGGDDVRPDQP